MNNANESPRAKMVLTLLLFALCSACVWMGCMGSSGDVQLVAESREGVFYTDIAQARLVAQKENKPLLMDMWRPG